jgi:hypothetical protein
VHAHQVPVAGQAHVALEAVGALLQRQRVRGQRVRGQRVRGQRVRGQRVRGQRGARRRAARLAGWRTRRRSSRKCRERDSGPDRDPGIVATSGSSPILDLPNLSSLGEEHQTQVPRHHQTTTSTTNRSYQIECAMAAPTRRDCCEVGSRQRRPGSARIEAGPAQLRLVTTSPRGEPQDTLGP